MLVEDERGRLLVLKLITEIGEDAYAFAHVLEHVRTQLPGHPGLLPVTDVGVTEDGVYLASPLLDVPNVEGRLRGGRQTLDSTLAWLRPVVAGLQAAHDAGLWHGAIHPKDVLVPDEGGVLTGVGVAPALEHLSLQAPVRVPYTAPERASGRPWDARADQYSLAMLALDALSGRRLIAGTIPAFDRWTLAETPPEDARLHEVFGRALHPEPDQRYPSLGEWLAALAGPERAAQGALSRFAREGVILASPLEAAAEEPPREVEVQPLEDPEGVALSLFPEEGGLIDKSVPEPTAVAAAPDPGEQDEAEQEWLVADVPEEAAAVPEPEPLTYRASPTEHPPIDAPTVGAPLPAEWRLDDEEAPTGIAEPPRSWDTPAEDSPRRGPWLLVVVLLVLAGLGYGTWRSLMGTPDGGTSAERGGVAGDSGGAASGTSPEPASSSAAGDSVAGAPAQRPDRAVVPQAPVNEPAQTQAARTPRPTPPAATPPRAATTAPTDETAAAGSVPATGRALIRSSPAGSVRVNGQPRGETPVVLRDLPFGTYAIAISRPGFQTVERELTLLPSQPVASLSVDLVRGEGVAAAPSAPSGPPSDATRQDAAPAPASAASSSTGPAPPPAASRPADTGQTGGLFVTSTPAAARLFVDGRAYGSTPAGIPGLTAGVHRVRVEAPGYRPWEGQVVVVAGTRARVQATLQQEQE